jgi:mannosyltransferase
MGVVGLSAILYCLKLPLSIDEAVSLNEALQPTAASVIESIKTWDEGKPPLYFLLLHYWLMLAPPTELWLRLPSVLFATLSIPSLFGVGRAFFGVWPAVVASALLAVNPAFIAAASSARMYSAFFFLTLLSVDALRRLVDRPRGVHAVYYTMVMVGLLYLHLFAFLVVAVHLLWAVWKGRSAAAWVGGLLLGAGVLYSPWLSTALSQVQSAATRPVATGWIPRPTASNVVGVAKHLAGTPVLAVRFVLLALVGFSTLVTARRGSAPRVADIVPVWFLCPIVLVFVASWIVTPIYVSHYLLFVLPAFLYLVAERLCATGSRSARAGILLFVVCRAFSVSAVRDVLHVSQRIDWRAVSAAIQALRGDGDVVLIEDPAQRLPDAFYDATGVIAGVPKEFSVELARRASQFELSVHGEHAWLVRQGLAISKGVVPVVMVGTTAIYRFPRSLVRSGHPMHTAFP